MSASPHIFAVAGGLPFLAESVRALLENRLIANADMQNPAALADTSVYVPSKHIAAALRSAFVEAAPHKASFLPNIYTLGEMEENDFIRAAENFNINAGADSAANAERTLTEATSIAALDRQILLARLILPWREHLPNHIRDLFGHESIETPVNTADALWLARALAALMDELAAENIDPKNLANLAPDDLAEWWQIVAEFLRCVFDVWPQILAKRNTVEAAVLRNIRLKNAAERLKENARAADLPLLSNGEKNKPVLVLGSTGSLPAVADFIKTVAYLPQGAVVLPALDRDLERDTWENLDSNPHNAAAFAHPQFALKRLLQKLNVKRENVLFLGKSSPEQRKREKWISEIFRPAETTEQWQKFITLQKSENKDKAESKIDSAAFTLIEAANAREEALAIAVCLRESLEEKNTRTALITGDRILARRVRGELARFGIEVNDLGGTPLAESEPAALLRLLLSCIFMPGDAVALLSLLKHPLTRLGLTRADLRRQAEQFEFFALRGGAGRINLAEASRFMEERLQKLTQTEKINTLLTAERMDESLRLAQILETAAAPLYRLTQKKEKINLQEALTATIMVFENFGRDEKNSLHRLYAEAAGQKLIGFCRALLASNTELSFPPAEWPKILEALIADESVAMRQSTHARLFISGFFEARLQNFDKVIIGGLNEGSLPHNPQNSPFLSRMMKAALKLPPPEQKIGFSAHDMAQFLSAKTVTLTRAARAENAPAIASRWLQRLQTVTGSEAFAAMKKRGYRYIHLAQSLDYEEAKPFALRPNPKPPLHLRPKKFSVTEIETLRRDPYALYAKRILKLRALDPIIRDEDVAERGTLYHAILAAFSHSCAAADIAAIPEQAEKLLLDLAREEFVKLQLPADIEALWWPRFCALAPHYLQWEAGLSPRRRYAEILAEETPICETGCFLRGRADRIDILAAKNKNGNYCAEIIDFKTGSNPSKKQAQILAAPQLALEGALLRRGSFRDCPAACLKDLFYIRLKADGLLQAEDIAETKARNLSAELLAEAAWRQLEKLILYFQNQDNGYLAKALPSLNNYIGDYDHLARVFEWSANAGEQE